MQCFIIFFFPIIIALSWTFPVTKLDLTELSLKSKASIFHNFLSGLKFEEQLMYWMSALLLTILCIFFLYSSLYFQCAILGPKHPTSPWRILSRSLPSTQVLEKSKKVPRVKYISILAQATPWHQVHYILVFAAAAALHQSRHTDKHLLHPPSAPARQVLGLSLFNVGMLDRNQKANTDKSISLAGMVPLEPLKTFLSFLWLWSGFIATTTSLASITPLIQPPLVIAVLLRRQQSLGKYNLKQ